MNTIVIYATKKGSSELYAKTFAQNNRYRIFKQEQVSSEELAKADEVYYFGSVYAGKVIGLEELKKKLSGNSHLTIISVGLTAVKDQEKLAEIREGVSKEFPQASFYHLRGRLIKQQLNMPEKIILKMISKSSKKKPLQEKLEIEKAIEQAVDEGCVDCIDLSELEKIG